MKIIHIETKSNADIMPAVRESFRFIDRKGKVAIVFTIQHLHKLEEAKGFLGKNRVKVEIAGQVLGCKVPKISKDIDQILYIGSGRFHPVGIFMRTGKDVIAANPLTGSVAKITQKDVEAIEKRKKGALAKFLSSEKIGVLITTKPGQANVQGGKKRIEEIMRRYNDKKFYTFAFDTLQKNELENFTFIECWVNTACPRIFEDFERGMVNIEDVL